VRRRVAEALVLGALLGLWATTLAGRALAAPPAALAVSIVVLPYLYLGFLAVAFGVWTALPDRRSLPLALLGGLLTALALWAPGGASVDAAEVRDPVRVMSWNVQRLWGVPDGEALRCAVGVLSEEKPDVLALLEVSAAELRELALVSGLDCRQYPYTSQEGPTRGGLAACVQRGGWTLARAERARFRDDEDWNYLLAEVTRGDARLNLLVTHLYPYRSVARKLTAGVDRLADGDPAPLLAFSEASERVSRGQSDQAVAVLDRVRGLRDPTVVAGDFNSTRDSALHVALRRELHDAWEVAGVGFGATVRLFGLPLRVDYAYVTPALGVVDARVPDTGCSDHDPVVVDLGFR
jgi:endonuclease/exonuclease/phosphatase (EEP) superfamily protein YafD